MEIPTTKNPYVGPNSFTEDNASRFFGRERELRDLVHLVIAERIVLLYSPSGAGKTSLLQAGLIPALRKERFRVLPLIRVNDPLEDTVVKDSANRFVMSTLQSLEKGLPEEERLNLDSATLGEMTLKEYLDRLPRPQPGPDEKPKHVPKYDVLIFDQFEEILTTEPASLAVRKLRYGFFEQVADALYDRRWAVFTLREDYLAGLDPYRRAVPTRLANHFRLDLLKRDDARQAIVQPPQVILTSPGHDVSTPFAPVTFAEDAVTRLLDDLGGGQRNSDDQMAVAEQAGNSLYIEPLHLQVVCDRLWDQVKPQPGAIITTEHIEASDDVDSALRAYYDKGVAKIAESFPDVEERDIRDWFEHGLILKEQGIRGLVTHGPTQSGGLENRIVEALVEAKLVNRETRLNATRYELAHDRLIRPVRDSNDSWSARHLNHTQRAAAEWDRTDKPDTALLGVRDWVSAKRWSSQPDVHLRNYEQRFVDQSGAVLRRRLLLYVVPVALLLVVAVVVWGVMETRQDERANVLTISSGWAGLGLSMLPLETGEQDQLDLGLLLAVEAVQYLESEGIPVSFDARNSLFNGLVVQPYFVAPIQIEPTLAATTPAAGSSTAASVSDAPVAISGDSRFIATTDGHGWVVLASLPTPSIAPSVSALSYLPQSETQGTGSVTALALSLANVQGAALLAVGEADGAIGVWDVSNPFTPEPLTTFAPRVVDSNCDLDEANPPPLATVSSVDVAVTSLTFDQGGLLAAGYGDGIVGLWDVTNVQDPQPPLMLRPSTEDADCGSGVLNLIFNPADGSNQLIAGYTDGSILSWGDPREDQEIVSLDSLSEGNGDQETARVHYLSRGISVDALALSPDGRFLAFGGQNGLFLRHLGTDQLLQPSAQPVTGLAFNSLDATTLFSSHENGGIVRWNVPRATIADDPRIRAVLSEATEHAVFEIATTPDSRWLVSRAADGRAVLWNPLGMPPIAQSVSGPLPAHTSCVASLVFDAEASVLVSVGGDGTEAPWDLNRIPTTPVPASAPSTLGTPLIQGPVPGVQPSVSSPQSRPPGVSTPESGAAATRSCAERDHLTPSNLESFGLDPEAIGTGIISIDQSHDGNLLAAGRENGEIVIWEDIDGEWELLGPLPGHLSAVTSLSFEGDERYLASGDANGWVVVWNLQTDEWIDFALTRAGRTLTCEEIRDDLNRNPPEEWEPTCQQTTE